MDSHGGSDLSAHLARSSSDFARSSLQALPEGKHATFLLHAATALEHLAKAVLAARHPSLIIAAEDFDSLLHACGEPTFARRPRTRIRTIPAREAIKRSCRFVPAVDDLAGDLELLILVRNGVVHLGEASSSDSDDVLVPYLKASEELRAALDLDPAAYWGEFIDLVDSALKEHVEKARLRVETALAVARKEFERRYGELDETTRQALRRVIEASYALAKYEEQLIECPACDTQAFVSGSLKTDYDEDWDHHEGVLLNVHLMVTFIPTRLSCTACGLELDGREELDAAGVGESWVLDDVDEADFYDHDQEGW